MQMLLMLGYLLMVHLSIWLGWPLAKAVALVLLSMLVLFKSLARKKIWAWLLVLLATLGSAWLVRSELAIYFFYLPPLLMFGFFAWLFGQSLLPGERALITRVALLTRQESYAQMPDPLKRYTRQVTLVWTGMFVLLGMTSMILALTNTMLWSWFTNLVSYLLVGALMLLELAWRHWRYAEFQPEKPAEFIAMMRRIDWRKI